MDWTEIKITVPSSDFDTASDIVSMAAPYGFYAEDYRDVENEAREIANIDLIDEALLAKDRTHCVFHIYVSDSDVPAEITACVRELLRAAGISCELDLSSCREEDWANGWKKYFHTTPVGDRLLIRPSWEPMPADTGGRAVLTLDPGAAFGTGTHETTRLCLAALEKRMRPDCTVLDVGCGSGILAISALLLGAKSAVGVDIDPLAVDAAKDNGRVNGFGPPRFRVMQGDLVDKVDGVFDIVTANIAADAVMALSPQIIRFLAPGGVYLASGIIDSRVKEVEDSLSACGFTIVEHTVLGIWSAFACEAGPH